MTDNYPLYSKHLILHKYRIYLVKCHTFKIVAPLEWCHTKCYNYELSILFSRIKWWSILKSRCTNFDTKVINTAAFNQVNKVAFNSFTKSCTYWGINIMNSSSSTQFQAPGNISCIKLCKPVMLHFLCKLSIVCQLLD